MRHGSNVDASGVAAPEQAGFGRWRALWRDPLVHFALAGLALFLLYDVVSPGDVGSDRIVVSQQRVDDFASQFEATWNRPPTPEELSGLVETFVRDEIVYRRGLAMGLADDDAVIKRRVRQKYDLMAEESGGPSAPSEAELEAYLEANPAAFRRAPVVTFDQIFFDPALNSPESVTVIKLGLGTGSDGAGLGQPSLLPRHVEAMSLDLVAADFGEGFAAQLRTAPEGTWIGPVASGLGAHLVRLNQRTDPGVPPLAQVRDEVTREWENDRRVRNREADYARLRADYDVVLPASVTAAARP
jgi:hypothetical protein